MTRSDYLKQFQELVRARRVSDASTLLTQAISLWDSAIQNPDCDPTRTSFLCGFMRQLIVEDGADGTPIVERASKIDVDAAALNPRSAIEALELLQVAGMTSACVELLAKSEVEPWFEAPNCREARILAMRSQVEFDLLRPRQP